jgi:MFS family permease
MATPVSSPEPSAWYRGITPYQWLVLVLASAGWVFDVYEGQIFNITRGQLLQSILGVSNPNDPIIRYYGDVFLGVFQIGGAVGGILFGSLADRWGRRPTLIVTILVYSAFSGFTFFARELWHVGALRFLVAVGVGGEWSVAAALVAEVFPPRSRAYAGSIFHASSILGTFLAALAGWVVGKEWRFVYLLGVLPALLIVAVRAGVAEPKTWLHTEGAARGSVRELLAHPLWRKRALLGLALAAVGLVTFWAITVAGQQLAQSQLEKQGAPDAQETAKLAYGIVQTAGGGVGLLAFGPLAMLWGRRPTFIIWHLAAMLIVPVTCYLPADYTQLLLLLPLYGFFTLGIHAGYAVYFPELFPTRLRATGAGFCFNGGRMVVAGALVFSGWLKALPQMEDLRLALTLLSALFLVGIAAVWFLPETKGQPLPE